MQATNAPAAPAKTKSTEAPSVVKSVVKAPAPVAAKPRVKVSTKPAASKKVAAKKAPAASKSAAVEKPEKVKKVKMVRDSFTFPKAEFAVLEDLKLRGAKLAVPVKKTELIRAGIKALAAMGDANFLAAIRAVPSLKTGRPAKS